jgi:hypothetical protein
LWIEEKYGLELSEGDWKSIRAEVESTCYSTLASFPSAGDSSISGQESDGLSGSPLAAYYDGDYSM